MLTLIFARHGAYERNSLTEYGQKEIRSTAQQMHENGVKPDLIMTSSLERAIESANIYAASLEVEGVLENGILYDYNEDKFQSQFLEVIPSKAAVVLCVSHEPEIKKITRRFGCEFHATTGSAILTAFKAENWLTVGENNLQLHLINDFYPSVRR